METPETPPTDADTARELANVQSEPLLAAEKWLIGASLSTGALLLGVLLWVSRTYFQVGQ
jgi:hypothetical protein